MSISGGEAGGRDDPMIVSRLAPYTTPGGEGRRRPALVRSLRSVPLLGPSVTTSPSSDAVRGDDDLLLKVTPPRVPRHLLARRQLQLGESRRLRDCPVLLVQAPDTGMTVASLGTGDTLHISPQTRAFYQRMRYRPAWLDREEKPGPKAAALHATIGRAGHGGSRTESGAVDA